MNFGISKLKLKKSLSSRALHVVTLCVLRVGGGGCLAALLAAGALCVALVTDKLGQAGQEGAVGEWACSRAHVLFPANATACQKHAEMALPPPTQGIEGI